MQASRPAIALLHGGGQGSWVWDSLVPYLDGAGVRTIALDVPGCGTKRERDAAQLEMGAVCDELIADIRRLFGPAPVTLVGHSLAGAIMPRLAKMAPKLFDRLIYVSCSAPQQGVSFLDQMGGGLQGDDPDQVGWPVDPQKHSLEERYRAMFCNDMDADQADAFLAKLGGDYWPMDVLLCEGHAYDHLASIPSTYLLCQQDRSLPPAWQRRFAKRLHCDRIVEIDAGHQAMNTQPEVIAASILEEIRELAIDVPEGGAKRVGTRPKF